MTIPNLGTTGLIQQPGIGGVIGQNLSALAQTLMARQQAEQERLKNEASIAYTNEQRLALQAERERAVAEAARQAQVSQLMGLLQERVPSGATQALPTFGGAVMSGFEMRPTRRRTPEEVMARPEYKPELYQSFMSAAAPVLAERQWESTLDSLSAARGGFLSPGQVASLRVMGREEGAKKLQEMLAPTKLGGNERLVQLGAAGGGVQTLAGTERQVDNTGDFKNWLAGEVNPATNTPYDPDTKPSDLSAEQAKRWREYQQRLEVVRAPKGTVVQSGETFARGLGEGAAEILKDSRARASDAAKDLVVIDNLRGLLDQGVIAGAGSEWLTNVGGVMAQLGIGGEATRSAVERTQAYAGMVGQRVGQVITMFGSGTGLSDADREYAQQIAAGSLKMTPGALKRLLDMAEKADEYLLTSHEEMVNQISPTLADPTVRQMYEVRRPVRQQPTRAAGTTYSYKGKAYPIIIGSDGNRYISTPDGSFRVP